MPEICENDTCSGFVGGHQDIVRLEISVYDIAIVKILYSFEDLPDDQSSIGVRDIAAFGVDVREQVAPTNELLEDVSNRNQ